MDETPLFFFRQIVAQPLMWLMLITIAMGMCLMNGYSVFKEHPPIKKVGGEDFRPHTSHLWKKIGIYNHKLKKFFQPA